MSVDKLFSPEQLYLAYRKAKIDVFYERSQPMAEAFCEYERDLHGNLCGLKKRLTTPDWESDANFIGSVSYIPKRLTPPTTEHCDSVHFSQSDPMDTWKYLLKCWGGRKPTVEFRPVSGFTVNMHVTSALWVNQIGHKFDACLGKDARGTRLRRLRKNQQGTEFRKFHIEAPGSFEPYFYGYREWRDQGLKAIRSELSKRRKVVALTMDLASFYHRVDPRFIVNEHFQDSISFQQKNGDRPLEECENRFTGQIITAFETWGKMHHHREKGDVLGLPVGVPAARIIANVLLAEFDRLVSKGLEPIYYGRYVDDIFLVIRDTGVYKEPKDVLQHLVKRIAPLTECDDGLRLEFQYQEKSDLVFSREKQRIFLLSGEIGEGLIDAIESKIDEVSSEWRLLPNIDDLARTPAARVLTAAKHGSDDVDSLRKADELTLRRLGFSLMLRSVDALARDLPPEEWIAERSRFYRFSITHVITPLRVLDLNDYLPRLFGIAVACRDWVDADRLVKRIDRVLRDLQEHSTTASGDGNDHWNGYRSFLGQSLTEAALGAYPIEETTEGNRLQRLIGEVAKKFEGTPPDSPHGNPTCYERSVNLFWGDFSRRPLKTVLLDELDLREQGHSLDETQLPETQRLRAAEIRKFLTEINAREINTREIKSLLPFLFPTRPLGVPEITELLPQTTQDLDKLRHLVHQLRGTWVKPGEQGAKVDNVIQIGK